MLVIKDMEMPKSCILCPFMDNDGWYCCDVNPMVKTDIVGERRAKNCPLTKIVTCKDCENWEKDLSPRVPTNKEYHFCPMMDMYTNEGFYCKDGERREE